jgi:RNA polymerase sigma-70 factor (ECF subfamily)
MASDAYLQTGGSFVEAADTELLARAVNGEPAALELLLTTHGPTVRKSLAGRIPGRWRSVLSEDDVMQQTYADAFRDIRRFAAQTKGAFGAWLTQVARRNLLDAVKMLEADKRGGERRQVHAVGSDESYCDLYEVLQVDSATPSRIVARQEAKASLMTALKAIASDYRQVVILYDLEQRTAQEVAEAIGRSRGAMFMLRARAHDRLRNAMGDSSAFISKDA